MAIYNYKAISDSGQVLVGKLEAESEEVATKLLQSQGLLPRSLTKVGSARAFLLSRLQAGLSKEQFQLFSRELLALLKAGISIQAAIQSLSANQPVTAFKQVLVNVLQDIKSGASFAKACSRHSRYFDRLFVATVALGEESGNLIGPLEHYQDRLKFDISFRRHIKRALSYPVFLLLVLIAIVCVLFAFVLPRFISMYADFGAALPAATQLLLDVTASLYWLLPSIAVLAAFLAICYSVWRSTPKGRLIADSAKLRMPFLGTLLKTYSWVDIAGTLSVLIRSGVPVRHALTVLHDLQSNYYLKEVLQHTIDSISEGHELSSSMLHWGLLSDTAAHIVGAGEQSGHLDDMFQEVAEYYSEQMKYNLSQLVSLLEPLLMLLMGVFIGAVIIVMYLPIFNLAEVIR